MHHRIQWPDLERGLDAPWMLFVDGENLAIQGQKLAEAEGIELMPGPYYEAESFLWPPSYGHSSLLSSLAGELRPFPRFPPLQAHYYTTAVGDDRLIASLRLKIREAGFKPHVFKKQSKAKKTKGVDISLARDLLVHGFEGGFSFALLIAGDQDYLPLVEELQSRRLAVFVSFFEAGMGPRLRAEADFFFPLDRTFKLFWDGYLFPQLAQQQVGALNVSHHAKRVDPDPRVVHDIVDHLRLSLGEHAFRLPPTKAIGRHTPGPELKAAVKKALRTAKDPAAVAIREAL